MPFLPRDPSRGDPITPELPRQQDAEILRLGRLRSASGLRSRTGPGGISFSLDLAERVFLRLTSSADGSGAYAWVEVYHKHALTWTVSADRTGTQTEDPAYERGGNTSLTSGDAVYEARRCPTSGEWLFDA